MVNLRYMPNNLYKFWLVKTCLITIDTVISKTIFGGNK